jgi:CreA protein
MCTWLGFMLFAAWCSGAAPGLAQARIGSTNTNFRWLGPDDKIGIERSDDPRVENVSCYLSRAQTGGIRGGIRVAEDPSRFLDCLSPLSGRDSIQPTKIGSGGVLVSVAVLKNIPDPPYVRYGEKCVTASVSCRSPPGDCCLMAVETIGIQIR